MAPRFIVVERFHIAIGWLSEVIDTKLQRRILIAGTDRIERAERRAADLNAASEKGLECEQPRP